MHQTHQSAEFVCSAITRKPGIRGLFVLRPYTMEVRVRAADGSMGLPTRVQGNSPQKLHENVPDIVRVLRQEQEADAAVKDRGQHLRDAAEISRWHLWRKNIVVGKEGIQRGSVKHLIF